MQEKNINNLRYDKETIELLSPLFNEYKKIIDTEIVVFTDAIVAWLHCEKMLNLLRKQGYKI